MCFRSNISETVRDIRVPFSLWPRPRVTLSNGANNVSVVVIVPEIFDRKQPWISNADLFDRADSKSRRTIVRTALLSSHNKTVIIVSMCPPSLQEHYIRCLSYLILKIWVENCIIKTHDALTRRYGPSVDVSMWKLSEKRIKCSCF